MSNQDYGFWGRVKRRPESHYYNVQRDEYVKKEVPRSLLAKPAPGWEFDRELSLYVKREPASIQFAVDEKGKRTFGLDQVIRDNPDRAREILGVLRRKAERGEYGYDEDRWLKGYVEDYQNRLGKISALTSRRRDLSPAERIYGNSGVSFG